MNSETDSHHHPQPSADPADDHCRSPAALAEKRFVDPVCGMKVAANPDKAVLHEGHEYFFCSSRCKEKFSADPAAYLNRDPVAPQAPAPAGTFAFVYNSLGVPIAAGLLYPIAAGTGHVDQTIFSVPAT